MNTKIDSAQLKRSAVVYVRQSTALQVAENLESQRRQYGLVEQARQLGFQDVHVIDDDLGISGSGLVARPGFQKLVAEVCGGQIGAVFCIEASRLARNGRDWHHLIDFCALVGAVVIDPDGVYDPRLPNDRLLLGLKGTLSEFELTLIRQRSLEAIRAKAQRGELRFCLPVGLCWTEEGRVEIAADRRVQQSIRFVFRKFTELGSVRQVLLWIRREKINLPTASFGSQSRAPVWRVPSYNSVHNMITNPMYAGVYAFGKTEARMRVVGDRGRKTAGHAKPMDQWTVLIRDHHPGYISWETFERNQRTLAQNAHMKKRMAPKAGRGGRGLLAGLLRCRRCGRMLHVTYTGLGSRIVRYGCRGASVNHGVDERCISFGALRPDEAIARALLDAVSSSAIIAAVNEAERMAREQGDKQQALALELEQARYEVGLASRRYEAVDPANRLVAGELEARWNAGLKRVADLEQRCTDLASAREVARPIDRAELLTIAKSLPVLWNSPSADMRLKQRLVRLLIRELVADVDDVRSEIVLVLHWHGGRHTELRVPKNKTGRHGHRTSDEARDIVRRMAGRWPDEQIAATLNRLGLRTGAGNTWNDHRVYMLRHDLKLPAFDPDAVDQSGVLTLGDAARKLGVSETLVRRLIGDGLIPASQVAPCAPYEIAQDALDRAAVKRAIHEARTLGRVVSARAADRRTLSLPGLDSEPMPPSRTR